MSHACKYRLVSEVPRRAANALNVEVGAPMPRCILKRPAHWPASASALRWMGSGGDVLVFGLCNTNCPGESLAGQQILGE